MQEDVITSFFDLNSIGTESSKVLKQLNEVYDSLKKIDSYKLTIDKSGTLRQATDGMRAIREETDKLERSQAKLIITTQQSAWGKINGEYKEAVKNARDLAAQFGVQSEQAQKAIAAAEAYRQKLTEINNAIKKSGGSKAEAFDPNSIPFTSNLDEIEKMNAEIDRGLEEQGKRLDETGDAWERLHERERAAMEGASANVEDGKNALEGFSSETIALSENIKAAVSAQAENAAALVRNKAAQKELNDEISKSGGATEAQRSRMAALKAEELQLSAANRQLQKEISDQTREFMAASGSLNELRAKLSQLTQQYDALSEAERNSEFGKGLKDQIKSVSGELLKLENDTNRFGRSVGNYSGALEAQAHKLQSVILQIRGLQGPTRLISHLFGLEGDDLNQVRIVFEHLMQGYRAIILNKAEKAKADAAETASTATNTAAQEANAAATGQAAAATAGEAVAIKAAATGQQGLAVATIATSGAMRVLRTVLITTGIGALVVAIGFLVAKMMEWSESAKETEIKQKALTDTVENTKSAFSEAQVAINGVTNAMEQAQRGIITKKEALDIYNESVGKTMGQVKDWSELEAKMTDEKAIKAWVDMMTYKAAANYAFQESAKSAVDAQIKLSSPAPKNTVSNAIEDFLGAPGLLTFSKSVDTRYEDATAATTKADSLKQIGLDFQKKMNEIAALFHFDPNGKQGDGDKGGNKTDYTKDIAKQLIDEQKALFEAQKIIMQDEIKAKEAFAGNEANYFNRRLESVQGFYNASLLLAQKQRDFDLKQLDDKTKADRDELERKKKGATPTQINELNAEIIALDKKAAAERTLINTQYNSAILKANEDSEKLLTSVVKNNEKERKDERDKALKEQLNSLTDGLAGDLKSIKKDQNEYANQLTDLYAAGKISKEQYDRDIEKLDIDAKEASIRREIAYYKQLISLANLPEEKKKEALKELDKYEEQLDDLNLKRKQKNAEKQAEIHRKMSEKLSELSKEVQTTVFDLLEKSIERQKQAIQEQMDLIDKRKEKEIEAVSQSVLSQQDKAAKIAEINARAQAQKEALERRQRQLDAQRAQFEKAKNIADIIQSTAQAVVSTLGAKPWTPANIALAAVVGAIGAAQLARAIATPIPKFFRGKNFDDKYEGIAWVDDGGRAEAIIREDGTVEIGTNQPRLTYLNSNDVVLPDAAMLAGYATKNSYDRVNGYTNPTVSDAQLLIAASRAQTQTIVKAIKSIPQPNVLVQNKLKSWLSSGQDSQEFLNQFR